MMNRRRIVGALAALSIGAASLPALGSAHTPTMAPSKSCSSSFVRARIGGATKCLHAGEYCAKAYKNQYRRYGFTCSGNPARLR
jgi:hypothetical protein